MKATGSADQYLFEEALLTMDRDAAFSIAGKYRKPSDLAEEILVPCLESIGVGWEAGRIALAQVYISARICEEILQNILQDRGGGEDHSPQVAIVLLEDYHSLGKTIVKSTLSAAGFAVLDLGRMDVEEIVVNLKKHSIEVLLISVLMLPPALRVRALKTRLDEENINTRLVVGGAPFRLDESLWKEVGADACGNVASDAIEIVRRFLGEKT